MKASFQYLAVTALVLGLSYVAMSAMASRIAASFNQSAAMIEESTNGRR